MDTGAFVPAPLMRRSWSPTMWAAVAASLGGAVAGFAGLYPRFDDGKLRIVLAVTSAVFAPLLVIAGARRTTRTRAVLSTLGLSAILGIAATVMPAVLLFGEKANAGVVGVIALFGTMFGAPTGMLYGAPLAVLAASTQRHAAPERATWFIASHRVARLAGVWLVAVAMLSLYGTLRLDLGDGAYSSGYGHIFLPAIAALVTGGAGLVVAFRAQLRLAQAGAWAERIAAGEEPGLFVRDVREGEILVDLPQLGAGRVVEWRRATTASNAYRVPAQEGVAIAVVDPTPGALLD